MSQRIKELLDTAVADVQPSVTDPVGTVVRRARVARLRAVAIGGLAVTVAMAGALVGVRQLTGDTPVQLGAPPADQRPPAPQLRDGQIVAGPLSLPVPPGWRVLPKKVVAEGPCGALARTARLHTPPARPPQADVFECHLADLEVVGTWNLLPGDFPRWLSNSVPEPWVPLVPRTVTLPGGEVAWLYTEPKWSADFTRILLPWSKVIINIRGSAASIGQQIIESIDVAPRRPAGLVLPEAPVLFLALPAPADRQGATTAEPDRVLRILDLLRDAPAAGGDGCADDGEPIARVDLAQSSQGDGWLPTANVVISGAGGCYQAASSAGGRARLTPEDVAELGDLFGVTLP